MVDWNEFCTYMLLQYQEKDAVHNRNAPFRLLYFSWLPEMFRLLYFSWLLKMFRLLNIIFRYSKVPKLISLESTNSKCKTG